MKKIEIYPSLLAADFSKLAEEMRIVENAGADGFHIDVMDGHFVPNISYGPPVIKSIRKATSLPFWTHLMIEEPDRYLEDYYNAGSQGIVFHVELDKNPVKIASQIRDLGIEPGISLNPETPVESILDILDYIDRVLIMTVNPGFGGQSFMPESLEKIPVIREATKGRKRPLAIDVDGGVSTQNAQEIISKGASGLIAGSSIFRAPDPAIALKEIRSEGEKGLAVKRDDG